MNIHELFSRMDEELGRRWGQAQSTEERELLRVAMNARDFIAATGQLYAFEDFRERLPSNRSSRGKVVELLTRLRDSVHSAEEKSVLQCVMDTQEFVEATGQSPGLEDYLRRRQEGAPPRVEASFKSLEEAEEWLLKHPAPPSSALVLIAGQYHQIFCFRELNHRKIQPWPAMQYYLADLRQTEPIVPVASFGTQDEAEAWLQAQSEPAERAWVSIAGQPYLAVHHSTVNHRALYPLSMADGYEVNYEVEA